MNMPPSSVANGDPPVQETELFMRRLLGRREEQLPHTVLQGPPYVSFLRQMQEQVHHWQLRRNDSDPFDLYHNLNCSLSRGL